jgi:hypothetical protein
VNSFLDIFEFEAPDEDEPREEEAYERPAWFGPPEDELGVCVPLSRVVGRSDTAVVALRQAIAYSNGVTLDFVAAARGLRERDTNRFFHSQHFGVVHAEDLSDAVLRIGIEFPGEIRVSSLVDRRHALRPDREPTGPVLFPSGGGGGTSGRGRVAMSPTYWLWPLPAAGPWRVFIEWPAVDVALSSLEIDGAAIVRAAAGSQQLWPT